MQQQCGALTVYSFLRVMLDATQYIMHQNTHEPTLIFIPSFHFSFNFYRSKDLLDVTGEVDVALSDFADCFEQVDLANTLLDLKEITVFAPSNDAFAKFTATSTSTVVKKVATNLLTGGDTYMWKDHLKDLVNYHVLPVVVPSLMITNGTTTSEMTVNTNAEEIEFTLKTAISGDTVIFVNTDAEVVVADIDIINGIVHVIDNVLLPSWVDKTIMDVAKEDPSADILTTLVRLLEEAELDGTLSAFGDSGYTVFAPTSAAFLVDIKDGIDLSPNQLSTVLDYHVVKGVYPESDLVAGLSLKTLQGETLIFTRTTTDDNGTTKVNDETIITTNILANNGIVHIIDGVLIPDG
jgi:transforming growth factor-beta-induced protein